MKNKIAAIGLLTVVVVALSILILQSTVSNIRYEAFILNSKIASTKIASDQITEGVLALPVYQKRSTSTYRNTSEYPTESSAYSVLPSHRSNDPGIAVTHSQPSSRAAANTRGSQRVSDGDYQVNYRPMAALPAWREKPSGAISSMTSGENTKNEQAVSKVNTPFSGGGISGPMRMDGDDENPPPEGMPVGNGLWFMILLAGAYVFVKNKKATLQH